MTLTRRFLLPLTLGLCSIGLTGCFTAPHNDYKLTSRALTGSVIGAGVGGTAAAVAHASIPGGLVVGGAAGMLVGHYMDSRIGLERSLIKEGVHVIHYGDHVYVVLPTDKLFYFESTKFKDHDYQMLNNLARYIKDYPTAPVTVTAYGDNIGDAHDKTLFTTKQANSVLAYLWAHGIDEHRLQAMGFGERHTVATNLTSDGSGMNRRVVIHINQMATA